MADFGTAVRNLRPGYIAKTTKMRGYVRRHELYSRSPNPSTEVGADAYLYYTYSNGARTQVDAGDVNAAKAALKPPTDRAADLVGLASDGKADVVFDLEFVENANYTDTDSKRVYVFRCFQVGGTETSYGDWRIWCVPTTSPAGADADVNNDSLPDSPSGVAVADSSKSAVSPMGVDSATFEMLVSQDWEYNQQLETDYVTSANSVERW